MDKINHQNDLKHIREMMENSSRFISLSGLAGVFAGIYALIASYVAYKTLNSYHVKYYDVPRIETFELIEKLILIGFVTLVLSIATGILVTVRKSKKNNLPIWTKTTYKLLVNLLIPLIAGFFFCLAFLYYNDIYYIAPATLIFYGLALINASKYTFGDIKYLGLSETILGIIALFFLGYGLVFWAIGFGVLHIIYGVIMYFKYK